MNSKDPLTCDGLNCFALIPQRCATITTTVSTSTFVSTKRKCSQIMSQ